MGVQICASKVASRKADVPALAWPGKDCLWLVSSIPGLCKLIVASFAAMVSHLLQQVRGSKGTTTALQFALSNVNTPGA